MTSKLKDMVAAATNAIPKVGTDEATRLVDQENAMILDVRDDAEVAKTGKIAGAVHVPRGMLEFRADPDSPHHEAAMDPDRPVVIYCAAGGRAALAGQTLTQMGYTRVYNLGGFKDAVEGGMDTDKD